MPAKPSSVILLALSLVVVAAGALLVLACTFENDHEKDALNGCFRVA
jgi:hypothetical protein